MGENELPLRQLLAQRLRKGSDPGLRCAIALVHRVEVFVVDVDSVQAVVKDELRERVGYPNGVGPIGRGLVRLAEGGGDDADARRGVFRLLRSALVGWEVCERAAWSKGPFAIVKNESATTL